MSTVCKNLCVKIFLGLSVMTMLPFTLLKRNINAEEFSNSEDVSIPYKNFDSGRLIITSRTPDDVSQYKDNIIGSHDDVYLMQFDSSEEAKQAYFNYMTTGNGGNYETDVQIKVQDQNKNSTLTVANQVKEVPEEKVNTNVMSANNNPLSTLNHKLPSQNRVFRLLKKVASSFNQPDNNYKVALLDSGLGNSDKVVNRVSMIGNTVDDDNGHGTQMARYIWDQAPEAEILSVKVVNDNGVGNVSDLYAGIEYAISQKVNIINISLSAVTRTYSPAIEQAVKDATNAGILVVGAAGNFNCNTMYTIPGQINDVITVNAVDKDGYMIDGTDYGALVDYGVEAQSTSEATAKLSGYLANNKCTPSNYVDVLINDIDKGGLHLPGKRRNAEDDSVPEPTLLQTAANTTARIYDWTTGGVIYSLAMRQLTSDYYTIGTDKFTKTGASFLGVASNLDPKKDGKNARVWDSSGKGSYTGAWKNSRTWNPTYNDGSTVNEYWTADHKYCRTVNTDYHGVWQCQHSHWGTNLTSDGSKHYWKCKHCGAITASGAHNYGNWSGWSSSGGKHVRSQKCKTCGYTNTQSHTPNQNGTGYWQGTRTCTAGATWHYRCSCGLENGTKAYGALGHDWSGTLDGWSHNGTQHWRVRHCKRNSSHTRNEQQANHQWTYGAWYDDSNYRIGHARKLTCKICGYVTYQTSGTKTQDGHSYGNWSGWSNYSNTQQRRSRKCTVCGHTDYGYQTRYYNVDVNVYSPNGSQDYKSGYIQLSNDGKNWSGNLTNEDSHAKGRTYGSYVYVKYVGPYYNYYELSKTAASAGDWTSAGTNIWRHTISGDGQNLNIYMKYKDYYIDLNGSLDGTGKSGISPMGFVDVYINGTLTGNTVQDFYKQYPYGTKYEIKNIRTNAGYAYKGNASYAGTVGAGNVSLTLPYVTNTYTFTYHENGGTNRTEVHTNIKYGTSLKVENYWTRAGYTPDGWSESSNGTSKYTPGQTFTMPAKNYDLYQRWKSNSVVVTFDGNGGVITQNETQTFTSGSNQKFADTGVVKPGYVLVGWSDKADGSEQYTPLSSVADGWIGNGGTRTVYAVWQPDSYMVTIPTEVSFINMNTGTVDQATSYNVNVNGRVGNSDKINVMAEKTTTLKNNDNTEQITATVTQEKSTWTPADITGKGTNSKDSIKLSGSVKTKDGFKGSVIYAAKLN